MSEPRGGFNIRPTVQWLLIAALAVVALVYFGVPLRAQDRPKWSAELWATEGGEELVAAVQSYEPDDELLAPTLVIMCGAYLRYDPGPDLNPGVDWTGRSATLAFDFGTQVIERDLAYEALDGLFAVALADDDAILAAIRSGTAVTVRALSDQFPANTFSLSGSAAAVAEMRRSC